MCISYILTGNGVGYIGCEYYIKSRWWKDNTNSCKYTGGIETYLNDDTA